MDVLPNSTFQPGRQVPEHQAPLRRSTRLPFLLLVLLGVILLAYVPTFMERIQYSRTRGEVRALHEALPELNLKGLSKAFTLVYRQVKPSVVHIKTRRELLVRDLGFDAPIDRGEQSYQEQSDASGVIVDPAGYIVTNLHVVEGASEITVTLDDGRAFPATVVGVDPKIDLAVLKIDASGLTAASWGDSDKLETGEMVWAIGNPFDLDQTVTSGIVSGKSRKGFAGNENMFEDFLQTDVAINPGSSGGPLVDIDGDVVGINTAIFGRTYQGVSFAVPSNLVREAYKRIRSEVRVVRSYLGVGLKTLTPLLANRFRFPPNVPGGVVVLAVTRGSPAEKAGIEPGDIIVEWNGKPVTQDEELRFLIGRTEVGTTVPVKLFRNGVEKIVQTSVVDRPAQLP